MAVYLGFVFCVVRASVLLQQSRNLLARNLLELTTSLPDAFSIQSGEIVVLRAFFTCSHSILNVLRSSFLELATSFLGASRLRQEKLLAFRKFFAESHSIFLVPTV